MDHSLKKILLIQTGFIGDTILSTPVISALKEIYPDSELSLMTTPLSAQLFKADHRIKHLIPYDKRVSNSGILGFFRMLRELKKYKFDVIYSLHKSFRTSLLAACSGIKPSFGFKEAKLNFLYSSSVSRQEYSHDVMRNLAILKNINYQPEDLKREMSLVIPLDLKNSMSEKVRTLEGSKTIVLAPGSVWLTKRWTDEGYLSLTKILLESGFNLVLIGAPSDEPIGAKISEVVPSSASKRFINLIGKLSLLESAAMISVSDVVVANDSAPLHLASATLRPVVALFCATVPEQGFGPWMNSHEIIEVKDLECRPCGRHGAQVCPTGTHFCRNKIEAAQIVSAVKRLVN